MPESYSAADIMTARQAADPYALYSVVRAQTPFAHGDNFWPLMKYADVYAALRDHETFSSEQGHNAGMPLVLLNNDPPRHTRFRKLVSRTFIPKRIAELEPWLQATSDELYDGLPAGDVEIVSNYTVPLPVKAIAKVLGIPGEEYQTFKRWTDALLSSTTGDEDGANRLAQLQEMMAYFGKMIALRREKGAEDLITLLVEGDTDEGKLDDWEILGFSMLLLIAGNETTTNLMGNLLNFLAVRPEWFARLKADRALIEPFIEEMLRYESPVQVLFRHTTKEAVLPSGGLGERG